VQIPTLSSQMSPSALRRELRYTLVRLRTPAWATTYRTTFESLLTLSESAIMEHIKLRDAAEDADAQLDQLDSELDEFALYLFKFMMAETTGTGRATLRQALFGTEKPSRFVRPRLGDKLARMRNWPTVLNGAPLAKLVAVGKDVDALIKRCDSALSAHATATANLQAFEFNTWTPFVAKVNGERQLLGGEAKKQYRLDGSEADAGLFRSVARARGKSPETLASVADQISRTEADLAALRQQKSDLEQQAQAEAAAEAARAQKEAELQALRKTVTDAKQKVQSLEAELTRHAK